MPGRRLFRPARYCKLLLGHDTRSGFKTSDHVREQGVLRIENGAYTSVREYFNLRDNAAIGHQMGFEATSKKKLKFLE